MSATIILKKICLLSCVTNANSIPSVADLVYLSGLFFCSHILQQVPLVSILCAEGGEGECRFKDRKFCWWGIKYSAGSNTSFCYTCAV
jgi:hypothetical protein